ncbi:MAG: translocation/assembly module TamB domain-containing protein [Pseudobdellovibrio sp.]
MKSNLRPGMTKLTKFIIYMGPLFILGLFILLWVYILHPQVINWVNTKIPELNASQNYVTLKYDDLDISLLKLKVTVKNVEVSFKNEFSKFPPLIVENIQAQLNPFELLIGQINISSITLNKVNWSISDSMIPASKDSISELPIDLIFHYLPQIPVTKIKFLNSTFTFTQTDKKLIFNSKLNSLVFEKFKNMLSISISKLSQSMQNGNNEPTVINADLATTIQPEKLTITYLNISDADSKIMIKGRLTQLKSALTHLVGEFSIDSVLHGDNLRSLFLSLWPQKTRIPSLTGQIQIAGLLKVNTIKDINGQFELATSNITLDHFKFGQAQIKMQIKKNQVLLNQIHFEHPAGIAELNQIEISQEKPYLFKTKLNVKTFNLQKLFISLNLNSIPVDLNLTGSTECAGQLSPPFDIECHAEADISDVWVKPSLKESFSIVKIKEGKIKGTVNFNNDDIQFDSTVTILKSTGLVKGVVDYAKGFKIDFDATNLNTTDIESIAGLDLIGQAQFKGTTWGDTSFGKIDAHLNINQGELEKFVLGQFSSELKYEKANLSFNKIAGHLGESNYLGDLNFNFADSTLAGKISLPQLNGEDVFTAIKKKFYLPFDLSGSGSADIQVSGPFDFWKLKYNLDANLNKGQIADESFERLNVNLIASGQVIDFKNVSLQKSRSRMNLGGRILTDSKQPKFDIDIKTNQSHIEEIDHFLKIVPTLTGQFNADGKIQGNLDFPEINFNFNTKQVNLDGIDYLPSQGQIGINKKYFALIGQLLGRQIQANVKWPWKDTDDYDIKLQVRDLNPLLFLPLASLPQTTNEYYSRMSLDLDLKANSKVLNTASGTIKFSDFILQRGGQSLKLKKSALVTFENGIKHMDPIELNGDDSQINIKLVPISKNKNNLDFDISLKLRLFQFLVPFVDNLNGQLEAQAQMALETDSLQLFGDGALVDTNVKLKGFPTPIEGITSPIEFSQSKIFFSDLTAHVGSSDVIGSGQIDIKGAKNINVQFQAQADSIEITFPEGITTAGKADMLFFGSWLPYNLKINYKVNRGFVEKDFGSDSSSAASLLKGSQYLPPKQFEQQIPSLLLDIGIDLTQGVVVKNKILEGIVSGNLNVKGTPEAPILLGKLDIKPGSKLYFKDKPFDIQNANIEFTQTKEINPNVFISSIARVSDYDITLLVQGPAKNLLIKPTSQPPLSENDIVSLLALGMTSSKMDQNLSSETQQTQTGIEVLAAISNQSNINKKIQETLGLTVQLAPSVDSTKNIAVPKVIVSKKIGKKLNASYARPLTGDNLNQEVKLQYLFNRNFSGILNYQNKDTTTQDTSIQNQKTVETGILGLDMEYKEEFK